MSQAQDQSGERSDSPARNDSLEDRAPRDPGSWMDIASAARAADPVISPCIGVCVMDAQSGLCSGCLRTLDEIASWSGASDERRRSIKAALPARRIQHKPAP